MSICFLVFLAGVLCDVSGLPPAPLVRDAAIAARAFLDQHRALKPEFAEFQWFPTSREKRGLTKFERPAAFPGYSLYTSGHECVAILVDMEGREVHRWSAPFSRVWPNARHVNDHVPDGKIFIRRTHLFPNGDLLALYESPLDTPPGRGLAKLDRDGHVLWTYDKNAHHDFAVGKNGNIYVLTHRVRTTPYPGWELMRLPIIEEFLAILSPDGRERKEISLFEALQNSPHDRSLFMLSDQIGDVLHSNTVNIIGKSFAAKHPGVSPGDLLTCFRNFNLVVAINPETESITWGTSGPWHLPHDPDALDNGRLLIFDNRFARGSVSGSRVVEFDPADGQVHWEYAASEDRPFRSDIRSCQQLLPNGNVLITESDYGRMFEVTRDGEIVWEFVNPVRGGENGRLIPVLCGATRYTADQVPFLKSWQRNHANP